MKKKTVKAQPVQKLKNIPVDKLTRDLVDSDEELFFAWWLQDLKAAGIIMDANLNRVNSFPLSMKIEHGFNQILNKGVKRKQELALHPHKYTPDYDILHHTKYRDAFYSVFIQGKKFPGQKVPMLSLDPMQHVTVVEVKPDFDQNNMSRLAMLNIKWVFEKYKHYVQLVKLPSFFDETFYPTKYINRERFTNKAGKSIMPPKIKIDNPKNITQFKAEMDAAADRLAKYHEGIGIQPKLPLEGVEKV